MHLMSALLRKGHSPAECMELIKSAGEGVATAEMVELTQSLLNEAGLEYTRHRDKPGMGKVIKQPIVLEPIKK
jgi:hypothetical protein